jgi:hypothetical protein
VNGRRRDQNINHQYRIGGGGGMGLAAGSAPNKTAITRRRRQETRRAIREENSIKEYRTQRSIRPVLTPETSKEASSVKQKSSRLKAAGA